MAKEDRLIKYDFIRIAAMLSVVLLHLCAHVNAEPYEIKWWVKSAFVLLFSTCNGLFFMLSGKFNLNERNSGEPIRFYKKRAISVVLPFLVCSLICFIAEKKFIGAGESYLTSLITVFPATHYWFVYELAGLIFLTPFFAVMMEHLNIKKKLLMTAVVLAFQCVFVFLKDIGIYPGYEFPLMGWPLFYLIGNFADEISDRWKKRIVAFGVCCYAISLLQMRLLPDASAGLQDLSPKYFFIVLALYYGFQQISIPAKAEGAILFFARFSYYVYLFHNTVILLFFSEKASIYGSLIGRTGTAVFMIIVLTASIIIPLLPGMLINKILDRIKIK